MKCRTVSCFLSLAAVLVYTSIAAAGPIPLPKTLGTPTGTFDAACPAGKIGVLPVPLSCGIGESDLASIFSEDTLPNVDWMVLAPGDYDAVAWSPIKGVVQFSAPGDPVPVVGAAAGTQYLYLYQAENTSPTGAAVPLGCDPLAGPAMPPPDGCVPDGNTLATLTITVPGSLVTIAGVLQTSPDAPLLANPNDDLDCGVDGTNGCASAFHPGHGGINIFNGVNTAEDLEPSLVEEEGDCPAFDFAGSMGDGPDATSFCINPPDLITASISSGSVSWTFTPRKPAHHETPTLFFFSPNAPVYGRAALLDGAPAPYSTLTPAGIVDPGCPSGVNCGFIGDPVPVPAAAIPEPTTLALFGSGLIALGLLRRRMKR